MFYLSFLVNVPFTFPCQCLYLYFLRLFTQSLLISLVSVLSLLLDLSGLPGPFLTLAILSGLKSAHPFGKAFPPFFPVKNFHVLEH